MKPNLAKRIVIENFEIAIRANNNPRGAYALPIEKNNPLFGFSPRFVDTVARRRLKERGYGGSAGSILYGYRGDDFFKSLGSRPYQDQ